MMAHNHFSDNLSITNKTKKRLPPLSWEKIKNSVLGNSYSLSIVVVGDAFSRKLNLKYRKKDRPANILSFPIAKDEGEIFINLSKAKKEAPKFDRNFDNFIAFLFIHGLMHLKGLTHGSKMDTEERKARAKFKLD